MSRIIIVLDKKGGFMKKIIVILCVLSVVCVGCLKGKKIVYTNPEKGIEITLKEEQVSVTGTHELEDGSTITVAEEE